MTSSVYLHLAWSSFFTKCPVMQNLTASCFCFSTTAPEVHQVVGGGGGVFRRWRITSVLRMDRLKSVNRSTSTPEWFKKFELTASIQDLVRLGEANFCFHHVVPGDVHHLSCVQIKTVPPPFSIQKSHFSSPTTQTRQGTTSVSLRETLVKNHHLPNKLKLKLSKKKSQIINLLNFLTFIIHVPEKYNQINS